MTDQMNADPLQPQLLPLLEEFLHPVFPNAVNPRLDGHIDPVGRNGFGDTQQGDLLLRAAAGGAGGGDLLPDSREIVPQPGGESLLLRPVNG